MADLSDVENALVTVVAGALFPGTVYQPGAHANSPVAGVIVSVFRGWPTTDVLNTDLMAGKAQVSVFSEPGMSRLTTRYAPVWQQVTQNVPAVTATVSGATVTLGGVATAQNVVGIQFGLGKLKSGYSFRFGPTDTLATAAAGLAAKVAGATSAGPVVTLPSGALPGLQSAVVCDQMSQVEVRRQTQGFRISCWCPDPTVRDKIAAAVDAGVAGLMDANGRLTQFLSLADGTGGYITYRTTYTDDKSGRERLWRRDICYMVEYATTLFEDQPELLFLVENVTANGQPVTRVGVVDIP